MKWYLLSLFVLSFLILVPSVSAETRVYVSDNGSTSETEVNVQTSTGENTICINGNCTKEKGGESTNTVCINGKCTTSSRDVHIKENNGETTIDIEEKKDVLSANSELKQEEIKKKIAEKHKEQKEKVTKIKEQVEDRKQEQKTKIESFMEQITDFFRSFSFF